MMKQSIESGDNSVNFQAGRDNVFDNCAIYFCGEQTSFSSLDIELIKIEISDAQSLIWKLHQENNSDCKNLILVGGLFCRENNLNLLEDIIWELLEKGVNIKCILQSPKSKHFQDVMDQCNIADEQEKQIIKNKFKELFELLSDVKEIIELKRSQEHDLGEFDIYYFDQLCRYEHHGIINDRFKPEIFSYKVNINQVLRNQFQIYTKNYNLIKYKNKHLASILRENEGGITLQWLLKKIS